MSEAGEDTLAARLRRLGLPNPGGLRFLAVGPGARSLREFARWQCAPVARSIRSLEELGPASERFDLVVWLGAGRHGPGLAEGFDALAQRLSGAGILVVEATLLRDGVTARATQDPSAPPSQSTLRHLLGGHACKLIHTGFPHPELGADFVREVHHVARRKPVVCLMMAPPGHGKTALAGQIFGRAEAMTVLGADTLMHRVVLGQVPADPALAEAIAEGFLPSRIDQAVQRVMDRGLVADWARLVTREAGGGDFVLEGFVPARWQAALQEALRGLGYLPVTLDWQRPQPLPMGAGEVGASVAGFEHAVAAAAEGPAAVGIGPEGIAGHLDVVSTHAGLVSLRGWAVTAAGYAPRAFRVGCGKQVLEILSLDAEERQDVREHLGLAHARVGFRLLARGQGRARLDPARVTVSVLDDQGRWQGPLHRSGG